MTAASASTPENETVTLVLRHPARFAGGEAAADEEGGVASRLIVTDAVAVPPPRVAEQVSVVPLVSVVMLVASQPVVDEIADSLSTTVHVTEMSLTYQSALPGVPVTVGVMTGGVASQPLA